MSAFSPTRAGYNKLLCTEDEFGNWRDGEGRLIYKKQGSGSPGSHVQMPRIGAGSGDTEGQDNLVKVGGTANSGAGHIAFSDPTYSEAWSNLPRRHPARCGVFQARLYQLGIHRLQGLR